VRMEDVYRRLAHRLDQIPNGFAATPSGAELLLLQKIFSPEEAALAIGMRLVPEPAAQIAERARMSLEEVLPQLKKMTRNGVIRMDRIGRELRFGLRPFVVGFYEEQLPRMDAEMAMLFERYYQELRGEAMTKIHRVLPVEEAVPFEMRIFPHERATALIESAKAWGVRDCICRTQQKLIGKGCDRPVGNCVCFAPVAGVFDHGTVTRAVSKDAALEVLREAERAGLVHTVANHRDGHFYICNCCPCCCGVLRSVKEFAAPAAIAHSAFHIEVASDVCAGCEDCLPRCPVQALSMVDGLCAADPHRCIGCGLCASTCRTGALQLVRLPEVDEAPLAENLDEWMRGRAQERGLDINEIL
jgi:Na+-translocating ferredoxin:NAD+ oxidoreductase subunit B